MAAIAKTDEKAWTVSEILDEIGHKLPTGQKLQWSVIRDLIDEIPEMSLSERTIGQICDTIVENMKRYQEEMVDSAARNQRFQIAQHEGQYHTRNGHDEQPNEQNRRRNFKNRERRRRKRQGRPPQSETTVEVVRKNGYGIAHSLPQNTSKQVPAPQVQSAWFSETSNRDLVPEHGTDDMDLQMAFDIVRANGYSIIIPPFNGWHNLTGTHLAHNDQGSNQIMYGRSEDTNSRRPSVDHQASGKYTIHGRIQDADCRDSTHDHRASPRIMHDPIHDLDILRPANEYQSGKQTMHDSPDDENSRRLVQDYPAGDQTMYNSLENIERTESGGLLKRKRVMGPGTLRSANHIFRASNQPHAISESGSFNFTPDNIQGDDRVVRDGDRRQQRQSGPRRDSSEPRRRVQCGARFG